MVVNPILAVLLADERNRDGFRVNEHAVGIDCIAE
jgi:hypothetical protein